MALINGRQMQERLQELLRRTSSEEGQGRFDEKERALTEDGQLSYTDSFTRDH
ncbi:MAG: hypothetical protein U1C56_01115 [Candidatus Curtissbacteria bacterium]|nr:hypothetical protein [Candidatus Curtissbacteria bacterium]